MFSSEPSDSLIDILEEMFKALNPKTKDIRRTIGPRKKGSVLNLLFAIRGNSIL